VGKKMQWIEEEEEEGEKGFKPSFRDWVAS
jgi:hypothetical protein